MKHLLKSLLLLLIAGTPPVYAQEWTEIQLPATMAEVPQLIQDRFGCTYQELPEKYELTHVRFTGTDISREDNDNTGRAALRAIIKKAKVIDLAQIQDNEQNRKYYEESSWYSGQYPGPGVIIERLTWAGSTDSLVHIIYPKKLVRMYSSFVSKNLKQVTWPDSVVDLCSGFFYNCTALEQMTLPKGITEVPSYCFQNCTSLTSVTIPSTVTTIGSEAFRNCEKLETITIPEGVETIEWSCFLYCELLSKVSLPQSLTSIGSSAFAHCYALTSLTLPAKLKKMDGSIFYQCQALTSITIPDSVQTIPEYSFYDCSALASIKLPAGLKAIGEYAFAYCSALTTVVLPDSVNTIGNNTFYMSGLEQFDMPDAVTELGTGVFESCEKLRRLHLSRQLTAIPEYTCAHCTNLEEVNIPYRVTRLEHDAFWDCSSLPEPTLHEGITFLGYSAFRNCRFTHITLPQTLKQIEYECFRTVPLRTIDVPASVVDIGHHAFAENDNLQQATLHEGLLYLQESAFADCKNLEDVALPNSLRLLGNWAFYNNKSKTTYRQPPLINVVPERVCEGCENLSEITLHDRVTEIGWAAFWDCKKLTHINLPQSLQTIGGWAFVSCPLEQIDIPSSVRTIDDRAFLDGAYSRVVVPEGVEIIGERAFFSETLRYVDFPSTISDLGDWAFQGDGHACDSIVLRTPVVPDCASNMLRSSYGPLYVPETAVPLFKAHASFKDIDVRPLTGYTPGYVVVNRTHSTADEGFPVINGVNLHIAHNTTATGGNLTIDSKTTWHVDNLRYDYYKPFWSSDDHWMPTLIAEGTLTAQTMEMYIDNLYPDNWFFFSPPFDMKASDLVYDDSRNPYALRTFDGAQRAAGNHHRVWQDVPADATLKAGRGYILQYGHYAQPTGLEKWSAIGYGQANKNRWHLKAMEPLRTLALESDDVAIELQEYKGQYPHNEGWNMVGNPYMAQYDIFYLDSDGPIIVADDNKNAFTAYSPLDDNLILRPLQSFLVQRSANRTSLVFHPQGRQADRDIHNNEVNSSRAIRRAQQRLQRIPYDAVLHRLTEQGDTTLARTRIVITPRATERYDRGQDAPFMTMNDSLTAIYSRTAGLRYSLNELPLTTTSVELGLHIAEPGTYTLSGRRLHGEAEQSAMFTLKDNETGIETDLLSGESYTFDVAEPGTYNSRFTLRLSDGIVTVPSGVSDGTIDSLQPQTLYDLQGRPVSKPEKGIYIRGGKKYTQY